MTYKSSSTHRVVHDDEIDYSLMQGDHTDLSNNDVDRPLTRKEQILLAREVFIWLPVSYSSDLVHGSWWFVWGSVLSILIPIPLLVDIRYPIFRTLDDTNLSAFCEAATWVLVIIAGILFSIGSLIWVRSFEDPPTPALCGLSSYCKTDEILAAWFFFLGALPTLPYVAIYLYKDYTELDYWALLIASVLAITASLLFLHACYKSATPGQAYRPILYPLFQAVFGEGNFIRKHLGSDWLITTWFVFYMCLSCIIGSLGIMALEIYKGNDRQIYIFATGAFDLLFFFLGSMYLLAGSYNPITKVGHALSFAYYDNASP